MADGVGADRIVAAIRQARGPAVCAYITAGYPDLESFPDVLRSVARAADLVEIGVPFTDPMADGLTIQEASRQALAAGTTLDLILDLLDEKTPDLAVPVLLMGYYNPFLAFGLDRLVEKMAGSGVDGLIVPDLPFEESAVLRDLLEPNGLALVQLVAPTTPADRLGLLAGASSGFVYAVTTSGVTGGSAQISDEALAYLREVGAATDTPVLAGFGIRSRSQVEALAPHVDGVVVGSALLEVIARGDDPGAFIAGLRPVGSAADRPSNPVPAQ